MSSKPLYKVTGRVGESIHGGDFTYPLPTPNDDGTWTPGAYVPEVPGVTLCERGYHWTDDPTQWLRRGCRIWLAEPTGLSAARKGDKYVSSGGRLLRECPEIVPQWWTDAMAFVDTIKDTPFLQPQGDPDPDWRVFDTWDAARDAAWYAARYAARDAARYAVRDAVRDAARYAAHDAASDAASGAARDLASTASNTARYAARYAAAAWDAALMAQIHIVSDLAVDQCHRDHATARWDVWQRGYGLLCDVDGVLYVYRINEYQETTHE